jgi:hypothetical protein
MYFTSLRWSRRIAAFALSAFILMLSACATDEKLLAITGEVIVGGKPAVGALLMFHPDPPGDPKTTFPATAKAGSDGKFSLDTGLKSGVRPGKYVVTITWPDPGKTLTDAQKMMGVNPEDAPDLLGGRYATREKTDLKADIQPGSTTSLKFELK